MPIDEIKFKDKDGFHYKYPDRSCKHCLSYPCLADMDKLQSNFAAFGCRNYQGDNTFNLCKK
jgi:hypothetical protein